MHRRKDSWIRSTLLGAALAVAGLGAAPAIGQQDLGPVQGEIRFSWWGGQSRNEKTDKILQLFEQENPGVKVARENSDWMPHWDKLKIQAAAGNQPCTIQMQTRWLATYANPSILRPLDDLYESGALDTTGIADAVIESSRGDDGNLYMIPSGVFYFALLYNASMLEAAGIEKPGADWTWSDFEQFIRDVAPHLPEGVNATHNMGRETDAFVTWVQSQGYKMFENGKVAFPKEVVVEWFDFWERLRKDGLTDSPEEMVADNGSLIEESNIANGRTFITNRPPNRLDSHQVVIDAVRPGEQLDILRYPAGDDGTTGMDLGANGIAIGATCPEDKLAAAVAWINFFTQDERAAAIYESDNGVVAIDRFQTEQAEGPNTSVGQRKQIRLFQDVAPGAKPVSWPNNGYGGVTEALNRAYDAVAFELMTPDEAAEQFMQELPGLIG
jgi:pectin-derived oligosaccharide transport system substrate-binding protein